MEIKKNHIKYYFYYTNMIKPLQQSKLATAFIDCMGRMQWMVEPACHWFRKCPDGDRQHYIHNDGACVNS